MKYVQFDKLLSIYWTIFLELGFSKRPGLLTRWSTYHTFSPANKCNPIQKLRKHIPLVKFIQTTFLHPILEIDLVERYWKKHI